MATSILVTKLFIPPTRTELVPRPELVDRFNNGLDRKLTLISAPAGFGKTTLVSHWLENLQNSQTVKVAWLSLDEDDNDPVRFLTYFVTALNKASNPENALGSGALSILQSPQPPGATDVLTLLINELAESDQQFIFVLDDYHLIEAKPIDQAVGFLLDNLPPQLHLVIATRQDPALSLGRLRAQNQVTELRAADLRFTSSEAAEFLNQVMGLDLSVQDITELEIRTEGWIAGLQLAAISMQGYQDHRAFIKSFTGGHRLVLDFLIEEVLDQQTQEIQDFLLQTSILDRMTGSLCDALTGQENGQEILDTLDRTNLFIVHLDEERHWYRYHHLFADLLRQRLNQRTPEEIPDIHKRASKWYSQHELVHEAIKHSLIAKDYNSANDLMKELAIDIIQQGDHTSVVEWINEMPERFVKERPYLCVLHAWTLQLTGQLKSADSRLVDAENALGNLNTDAESGTETILGLINFRRAYSTLLRGEHDKTISYGQQALKQLPETAALLRVRTVLFLDGAYRFQGKIQEALANYDEVTPIIQSIGISSTVVLLYLHQGDLHIEMAQLHRARDIYEDALKLIERQTGRSDMPYAGYVYVSIGRIFRQWNQLDDAYRFIVKGLALCRLWNVADILGLSLIELAYIHQSLGAYEKAFESLKEATNVFEGISTWGGKIAAAHQAKSDITHGDIGAAEHWVEANDLDLNSDFEFYREIEYLVLVRAFIAQRRYDEAHTLAERIYKIAQETGKRQTELEILILLAIVFSGQGKTEQALVHLERALNIGQPEGFIRTFVDEGPPMAKLLYEALQRDIYPEYVQRLLAAFPITEPDKDASTKSQADQSGLIEPLSEREIEVLQLLAKGLTNQEVAQRLYLSPHTIKTHTRNIYGKLGVNNRTQAVERARALGILSST
jgi:LuxR family maltose regulon positive regulatory protein